VIYTEPSDGLSVGELFLPFIIQSLIVEA